MTRSTFSKSQLTAILATVIDFSTLTVSVEWLGLHYVTGTIAGGMAGALTNFFANRRWAFRQGSQAYRAKLQRQFLRYLWVAAVSLALNTFLVVLLTEEVGTRYWISKLLGAVIVAWAWNYPMHRFYVFSLERNPSHGAAIHNLQ